jgi:hypothetical protein
MDKVKKSEKVVIAAGPPNNPYGKIIRTERRFRIEDRRRLYTYIADDRREGFADRRDNERFSPVQ